MNFDDDLLGSKSYIYGGVFINYLVDQYGEEKLKEFMKLLLDYIKVLVLR